MPALASVCVYCGSSPGARPDYAQAARDLAAALVRRSIRLIYGGASVGIMGAVADAVLERGGEAVGVIPEALIRKEVSHAGLTELHVTASMHERKATMAELADAFVALPGGIGTLEELTEIWTWAMLGLHAKPCGLLNAAGYYDRLVGFLDQVEAEQFVRAEHRRMLLVERSPDALLDAFERYEAPLVEKWLRRDQT